MAASNAIDFDVLEQNYQSALKSGKGIEQPEVLNPSAYAQTPSSGEEVAKGLLELGGMVVGGPIGGKVLKEGARYVLPKIAEAMSTAPRFLGLTERGAEVTGRLTGAGLGGGAGAVAGETIYPPSNVNLGAPNLKTAFLRGAGEGMAGEGMGQGIIKGLDKFILQPAARYMTGAPKGGLRPVDQSVLDDATNMGVILRPGEVTADDVAAQIEQNARRSMFGKKKFQERDIANEQAFRGTIENYADEVYGQARSTQDTGRLIQDALTNKAIPEFQAVNRGLYKVLHRQTDGQKLIPTHDIYERATGLSGAIDEKLYPKAHAIAKKIEDVVSERGYTTGMKVTRREGKAQLGPTVEGPPIQPPLERLKVVERSEGLPRPKNIDFMQAHDARALLLEINRTGEGLPNRARAVAGNLAESIDTAMEQAAVKYDAKHGTTLLNDWRVANASTKSGHALFDSQIVRTALAKNPEDVVRVAFNKNALTETDLLMQALKNDPDTKRIYQRAALQDLMTRAQSEGFLNGQTLWNAVYGKNGVGDEVMRRTFGEQHAAQLKRFFEVGHRMNLSTLPGNVGNPGQLGRNLINWFEQGMVINVPVSLAGGLATGNPLVGAGLAANTGAYILTVRYLANILNSPRGLYLLKKGMRMDEDFGKTAAGIRLMSNLIAIGAGHGLESVSTATPSQPSATIQPPIRSPRAFENQP